MTPSPTPPTPTPVVSTRDRTRTIALRLLREQGELVGAQRVRDELGYGSLQTINEELRLWRRELATRLERSLALPELPPALAAEAASFLQAWWERCLEHASAEADAERTDWMAKEAGWQTTLAQRDELLDQLERDREHSDQKLAQSERLVEEQARSLELLRAELAQARQQLNDEREVAAAQQRQHQEESQGLREQLDRQARQAATQQALLNDELLARQTQHEAALGALQQTQQRALRDQAAHTELLQHKIAAQSRDLALSQEKQSQAKQQVDTLTAELARVRQAGDALQQREQTALAQLSALQQALSRASAERDEARRLFEQFLARPRPGDQLADQDGQSS